MRNRQYHLREADRLERDAAAVHSERLSVLLKRLAHQWRSLPDGSNGVPAGYVGLLELGSDGSYPPAP